LGFEVDSNTPQGSVGSPMLFTLMIDDIFKEVGQGVGVALYAADGALWMRYVMVNYGMRKMQEAVGVVDDWSLTWGFRMSVAKSCFMVYSRRNLTDFRLQIYAQDIGSVSDLKYLGMWFNFVYFILFHLYLTR
jgi:hypothetical protein